MAQPRPQPIKHPTPASARDMVEQQRTASRTARPDPDPEAVASLLAEAERIMGVKPLTGRLRPLPGY